MRPGRTGPAAPSQPSVAATRIPKAPRVGRSPGGAVEVVPPKLPAVGMIVVAVAGAATAVWGSWLISLIAYLGVLVVGFGLIYLQRHLTNKAAISAQTLAAMRMPLIERLGIWCILGSCLVSAWVIALHVGRYGFGG